MVGIFVFFRAFTYQLLGLVVLGGGAPAIDPYAGICPSITTNHPANTTSSVTIPCGIATRVMALSSTSGQK